MNKINEKIENIIEQLIGEILSITNPNSNHWNERYLHHRFSHLVQNDPDYEIKISNTKSLFHPEWATFIKDKGNDCVHRDGGLYAKEKDEKGKDGYYIPKNTYEGSNGGSSGFIDFAIGEYNNPKYAIEFKMAPYMDAKGFAFDYMKLLDDRNIFEKAISLSVVYGRKTPLKKEDFDDNLYTAIDKLGDYWIKERRTFCFYVIQIIDEKHYVWKCDSIENRFVMIPNDSFKAHGE